MLHCTLNEVGSVYCISLIRRRCYYFSFFFSVGFSVATIEGSYYSRAVFILLPAEAATAACRRYSLIDAGSSTHNLSVLLSAVETSFRTLTALLSNASVSVDGNY